MHEWKLTPPGQYTNVVFVKRKYFHDFSRKNIFIAFKRWKTLVFYCSQALTKIFTCPRKQPDCLRSEKQQAEEVSRC